MGNTRYILILTLVLFAGVQTQAQAAPLSAASSTAIWHQLQFKNLFTLNSPAAGQNWSHVDALKDMNGDGISELIGGMTSSTGASPNLGGALVVSPTGGLPLYQWSGFLTGFTFGNWNGPAGDVNRDGAEDFLVTIAPDFYFSLPPPSGGFVVVFSGADGSPLQLLLPPAGTPIGSFGTIAFSLGDINLDGVPDFFVQNQPSDGFTPYQFSGFAYSGKTGQPLYGLPAIPTPPYIVTFVRDAGDTDGDGVHDVVTQIGFTGDVYLYSGKTGDLLWKKTMGDQYVLNTLGIGMGDINGDGASDILIGREVDSFNPSESPKVIVLSGKDGSTILEKTLGGSALSYNKMVRVSFLGDLNGDHHGEILVSTTWEAPFVLDGVTGVKLGKLPTPGTGLTPSGTLFPSFAVDGDFNHDGKRDIIGRDNSTGMLYLIGLQ